MKKICSMALALCLIVCLSACRMEPQETYQFLSGIAENLGESQITEETDLIGIRYSGEDSYTGTYQADCGGDTGRDVVFGGGSLESKKLRVHGSIRTDAGKATVRIRQNEEVTELSPDQDGSFETKLSLESGGNYIMISYEDFQGSVALISEYEAGASQKEG